MIEKIYALMKHYHFVNWGVLLLGISGLPGIDGRLQSKHIEDFATSELSSMTTSDLLFDLIASLALGSDASTAELCDALEKICQSREINRDDARRKWRLMAIETILSDLDADAVYGLMAIAGFWSAWARPKDAPFSMRKDRPDLSPEEYHSQQNFKHVIAEHQKWLVSEHAVFA
jgi:hypothetical protein